jgi:hypothetical protein
LINFIHGVFTLRSAGTIKILYLAYETLRRLISSLSIGGFQKEKVFENVVSVIPRRFFS